MPLPIVFVDQQVIVLDKPSGVLAVPGLGPENQDNLASRVQIEFADARVVHRLDRDTSGLIIFARTADAQRELGRQFQDRSVEKRYVAVVHGKVAEQEGQVDLPLKRDFANPPRYRVDARHGKKSVTEWRVLERFDERTRVELMPVTGRSHQLRVHMQQIGHPILGDKLYATADALAMADRLLLHAARLVIDHPSNGERMFFAADWPF